MPAALWAPLLTVAHLSEVPRGVDHSRLAHACRAIALWAEQQEAGATQLAFTQAAALLEPQNVRLACAVGRLARDRAEYTRAETWFRHAIRMGRKARDWEQYLWAYLGLGVLYLRKGNHPAADVLMCRVRSVARRRGYAELEARAAHHLFVIAAKRRDVDAATEHARSAFALYGPEHPRLLWLAQDLGCFWVDLGRGARALPVLEAILSHLDGAHERAFAHATAARAAAAAGDTERVRAHRQGALTALVDPSAHAGAAEVYLDLARAAASLGDWEEAEMLATRAAALASETGQASVRIAAENEREAVCGRRTASTSGTGSESYDAHQKAERLAHDLIGAMAAA